MDGGGGGGGEKESDSDSNDSDGFSKQERLRFKNERSGIINLSRVITRPGIPDTLGTVIRHWGLFGSPHLSPLATRHVMICYDVYVSLVAYVAAIVPSFNIQSLTDGFRH